MKSQKIVMKGLSPCMTRNRGRKAYDEVSKRLVAEGQVELGLRGMRRGFVVVP